MKLLLSSITLLLSSSTTLADKSEAAYGDYDTCHHGCYNDLEFTKKTDNVLLCLVGCIEVLKRSPEDPSSPGSSRVDALVSQTTPLLVQACYHACYGNPVIHGDTNALLQCLKPCDGIDDLNHIEPIHEVVPKDQVVPASTPEASTTNDNPVVNQTIPEFQVRTVETTQPTPETQLPPATVDTIQPTPEIHTPAAAESVQPTPETQTTAAAVSVQPVPESYIPDVETTPSTPGTPPPSDEVSLPIPDTYIPTVEDSQVIEEPYKPVETKPRKCHKHKKSTDQHA